MNEETAIFKIELKGKQYFIEKRLDGIFFFPVPEKESFKVGNGKWETLKDKMGNSMYCELRNLFVFTDEDY